MLFYRCGTALFYAGQIGGSARDPKAVKSPLQLELWRVAYDAQTISCELRCGADGWDVPLRSNGEALFSRRRVTEDEARYCAARVTGSLAARLDVCTLSWRTVDLRRAFRSGVAARGLRGPGKPCPSCNTKEPPDHPPGYRSAARVD
jgi:hypothetical protein